MVCEMKISIWLLIPIIVSCSTINDVPNYNGITLDTMGRNRCGLPQLLVEAVVTKYYRGPVDGAYDENGDGKIDQDEAFTGWDFNQLHIVLRQGKDNKPITWTNVDTCYKFEVTPHQYFEDPSQKIVWQTCREFSYKVYNNKKVYLGSRNNIVACRNIATHDWQIL